MNTDAQKFDAAVRKLLSVSPEELKLREEEWKRAKEAKRQARISPASRVSRAKD